MIVDHPEFVAPEDDKIKIWRYMDFTKLISLLDTGCLFFARADSVDDPFEGSYPRKNVELRKSVPKELDGESKDQYLKDINNNNNHYKQWPKYTAISCWHMNEFESAAMWSLYLKSDEGIAIQSSYKKLKKSIIDDEKVYLGVVKYIDYNSHFIEKNNNTLIPFVLKRKSFEHERELRAVMVKKPISSGIIDFNKETIKGGVPIKVNIEELIDKIYIAPNAPKWFYSLVKKIINEMYKFDIEVLPSDINNTPMF
jgi:hypothetical protein